MHLGYDKAAVYAENLPGHEACSFGGKVYYQLRHILRLPQQAKGGFLSYGLKLFVGKSFSMGVSITPGAMQLTLMPRGAAPWQGP